MLRRVRVPARRFADYRTFVPPQLYRDVQGLAKALKGRRILQINSTSKGGGVAELLRNETAILRDLGVEADWCVAPAPAEFFEITKKIHNGLQGGPVRLTAREWSRYEEENRRFAASLTSDRWDLVVVHDPQPCAMRSYVQDSTTRWIWRCHIDLSHANPDYVRRFTRYVDAYPAAVYSLDSYPLASRARNVIIPPAIDPFSPKNREMGRGEAERIVRRFGVDPRRPLVTQVSRFDPWKDPAGVVQAWKIARKSVPGLQLALVGQYADDDPEGETILTQLRALTNGLPDVYLVANEADDRAVHAFQSVSHVVLQKSLREGFGLTVSEALWAGTPVVGGAVGGIPLQVVDGRTGYLVRTIDEAAERIVRLVGDPKLHNRLGRAGRERVRRRFLVPRLLRDDLRLWRTVLGRPGGRRRSTRIVRPDAPRIRTARRLRRPHPVRVLSGGPVR